MVTRTVVFLMLALAGGGCATIPPGKIPLDRRNYLDAVSTSWKQQLLSNLIRLRYGDTLTFLELQSINTGYDLTTSAGLNYSRSFGAGGIGFPNVLAPSANVVITDRPTITYAPIRGDALAKTLITPLSLTSVLRSLQTGWRADYIFSCCIKAINDRRNRSGTGEMVGDAAFFKLAQDFRYLKSEGVVIITVDQAKETSQQDITKQVTEPPGQGLKPDKSGGKAQEKSIRDQTTRDMGDVTIAHLVVDRGRLEYLQGRALENKLSRFYNTLKLNPQLTTFRIFDGSKEYPAGPNQGDSIIIQTRSIKEILTMLCCFISIPAEHTTEGRAHHCKSTGLLNAQSEQDINSKDLMRLQILSSPQRPVDAFVDFQYQGYWFYIDNKDVDSKEIFSSTAAILSMSEPASQGGTPILTLPVQ